LQAFERLCRVCVVAEFDTCAAASGAKSAANLSFSKVEHKLQQRFFFEMFSAAAMHDLCTIPALLLQVMFV
jgi:hypothetical protein